MTDPSLPPFRFPTALRRSRLGRLAAVGALTVLPVACGGNSDAQTLGAGSSPSAGQGSTTALPAANAGSGADGSTVADNPAAAPAAGEVELVLDFTYTAGATDQGRVRNPYIAVWVEDRAGNLIQTVALWYDQSPKGERWLRDLRSWEVASGGDVTTSGATRAAGTCGTAPISTATPCPKASTRCSWSRPGNTARTRSRAARS